MFNSFKGMVTHLPAIEYFALNLLFTLVILVAGWTLSSFAGRALRRLAARSPHIDPTIVPMVESVTIWAIRIFVLVAVLARFGVQTASIVAVLGAAGVTIGLALQGTLQNIASGIMLLALRPLKAREYVSIVGKGDGTVQEVGLFLTYLVQSDGVLLSLPNSGVWGSTIINYSRNATRRLEIEVEVQDADKIDAAKSALKDLAESMHGVLQEPAPVVNVTGYNAGNTVLTLRLWTESTAYWELRLDIYRRAMALLADLGAGAPIPLRDVRSPGPAA